MHVVVRSLNVEWSGGEFESVPLPSSFSEGFPNPVAGSAVSIQTSMSASRDCLYCNEPPPCPGSHSCTHGPHPVTNLRRNMKAWPFQST